MKTKTITLLTLGGLIVLLVTMALAPPAFAELVGYWNFDNSLADQANWNTENTPVSTGGTFSYSSPGVGGTGAAGSFYNGGNGSATVGTNKNVFTAMTISAMVYPTSLYPTAYPYGRIWNTGQNTSLLLFNTITNKIEFWVNNSLAAQTGYNVLTLNTWQNVAATWDAAVQQANIYINGALSATSSFGQTSMIPDVAVIGANSYNLFLNESFHGKIDNVTIHNDALSASAISDLAAALGNPAGAGNVPEIPGGLVIPLLGILGTGLIFIRKKFFKEK